MIGEDRITIVLPAAVIFDVIADGEQNVHWRSNVLSTRRLTGDGGPGTEWQMERRGFGNRPQPSDYVVEQCDRPLLYAVRYLGGHLRGTATYTLTEREGVTDVALRLVGRATGAARLVGGAAPRALASELDDLKRLRAYLEERRQEAVSPG